VRSYNCLKREGIDTVGELRAALARQDLLDIRNFGAKSIDEVKAQACTRWAWASRTARTWFRPPHLAMSTTKLLRRHLRRGRATVSSLKPTTRRLSTRYLSDLVQLRRFDMHNANST
jgi:hypothetical protein